MPTQQVTMPNPQTAMSTQQTAMPTPQAAMPYAQMVVRKMAEKAVFSAKCTNFASVREIVYSPALVFNVNPRLRASIHTDAGAAHRIQS